MKKRIVVAVAALMCGHLALATEVPALHWPGDRRGSVWPMSCGLVSTATVEALLSADWYVDASIYLWRVCHDKEGARMAYEKACAALDESGEHDARCDRLAPRPAITNPGR